MATLETVLREHLLADEALRGLGVDGQVSWRVRAPGEALPAVVLHLISGGRQYTLKRRIGLRQARVQIDCWATAGAESTALKEAVIAAFDPDKLPAALRNGVTVLDEGAGQDAGDAPQTDGAKALYSASVDVRVWFRPTA